MAEQNFKNHTKIVYSYYLLTGVPIIILIVFAWIRIFENDANRDVWIIMVLIGWILITMLFRSRGFALKAQDRAIRAEENLRFFLLTGKKPDERLTLSQLIALRFASDEELPQLAKRAADENWSNKQIKQQIKHWRADHHRV